MKVKIAAILLSATTLVGCTEDQTEGDLAGCETSTAPVIQLRQASLMGKDKDDFEKCTKVASTDECRLLYLYAHKLIMACMRDRGYIFSDDDFYRAHGQDPILPEGRTNSRGSVLKDGVCTHDWYKVASCYHYKYLFMFRNPWAF